MIYEEVQIKVYLSWSFVQKLLKNILRFILSPIEVLSTYRFLEAKNEKPRGLEDLLGVGG